MPSGAEKSSHERSRSSALAGSAEQHLRAQRRALEEHAAVGGQVVENEAAHPREHGAHATVERERPHRVVRPDLGGREPDLAATRRPGDPVQAGPLLRGRDALAVAVEDPHQPPVVVHDRVLGDRQVAPVGRQAHPADPGDPGQDVAHRELDPEPWPSPERTTAKSEPSAAQSAATTPLRTSFGGPPDSGARASTPSSQEGHLPGRRDGRHRGVEDLERPRVARVRAPRRAGPGVRRPTSRSTRPARRARSARR